LSRSSGKSVPDISERLIALRLKEARLRRNMSQSALAALMRLTRDQLASIETARVPLRFWNGWAACDHFALNLNPAWLASGEGAPNPFVFYGFDPEEHNAVTERTLFSQGFAIIRQRYLIEWQAEMETKQFGRALAVNSLDSQGTLDTVHNLFNKPSMARPTESRWDLLLSRLRVTTQPFGAKARLAQQVGVKKQAVSQWLSGETRPTAETVLRLVEWVSIEETKQKKGARSAATRRAPTTRKNKSTTNEKAKSDRSEG
jgi:transcriptional regulator with XRE-family HTH domain